MKLSKKKKRFSVLSICLALIVVVAIGVFVISILHDKYGYFKDETPLVENEEELGDENATS